MSIIEKPRTDQTIYQPSSTVQFTILTFTADLPVMSNIPMLESSLTPEEFVQTCMVFGEENKARMGTIAIFNQVFLTIWPPIRSLAEEVYPPGTLAPLGENVVRFRQKYPDTLAMSLLTTQIWPLVAIVHYSQNVSTVKLCCDGKDHQNLLICRLYADKEEQDEDVLVKLTEEVLIFCNTLAPLWVVFDQLHTNPATRSRVELLVNQVMLPMVRHLCGNAIVFDAGLLRVTYEN